jgi:hypothetical protein
MEFDASVFFRFLIAALATWRLAFLLARERGPADIFRRLRRVAGDRVVGDAVTCVKCIGTWVALPFTFFIGGDWVQLVVIWLALAGVTALIDEWTRPPFEWQESSPSDRTEAVPSAASGTRR